MIELPSESPWSRESVRATRRRLARYSILRELAVIFAGTALGMACVEFFADGMISAILVQLWCAIFFGFLFAFFDGRVRRYDGYLIIQEMARDLKGMEKA